MGSPSFAWRVLLIVLALLSPSPFPKVQAYASLLSFAQALPLLRGGCSSPRERSQAERPFARWPLPVLSSRFSAWLTSRFPSQSHYRSQPFRSEEHTSELQSP